MNKFESYSGCLTWFMALLLSALVAGCGSGGGGGDGANPTTTVSGIAASGAPVIGGTVQMVCAGSTPGTAVTTGPDGGFTVTAPLNAPCVIRVSGGTGTIGGPLFSVVASSSQTRANVNQLTHMLAFLLAGGDPDTGLFQSPNSISSKITTTAVATHKATITASVIANLGAAAGIPTSFDFLEGIFTANHTGFDLVLDKIGFTAVGNTVSTVFNGAPLLAVDATTGVASTTSSAVISTTSLAGASTFGAPVTAKAITAYSLAGVTGTINETAKTLSVTMPAGTNVTALAATFMTTGAGLKLGAVAQTSGTTANDFTSPVAYTVTAADGTTATYTVTVTVASTSAKAITAYSLAGVTGTINETAKTLSVAMPAGTNVTALVATFTTTGAGVKLGAVAQTSATTANNFTSPVAYTVTAADGTTATYTVTVTVASTSAKAITAYSLAGIAGTINETAKTLSVAMPFGTNVTALVATLTTTGAGVKVGAVAQTSGTTANNFTSPVAYTVTAADGTTATYTVTVTVALNFAKAITAYSLAGVAGTINETAKTLSVTMPFGTNVTALVATFTTTGAGVKLGAVAQTSGTTPNNFTSPVAYTVTAADGTTATYTVTVTVALNFAKAITAYSLAGVAGTINETAKTLAVIMPNKTNVTALIATFTTTGAGVKLGTVAQTSGTTPNNFTSPVAYTVTAADSTTATYTVTVTVALGPLPVALGTAGNFVILTKTGITNVHSSAITGNIGSSPITAAAMDNVFCPEITGTIFGVNAAYTGNGATTCFAGNPGVPAVVPPDANKTLVDNAVLDMGTAFSDAAGRTSPDFTELGAGNISGLTLVPGLYKWGTGVLITGVGVTLSGGPNDVWIFQIAADLTVNNGAIVTLSGGAKPKNIFWQVSGQAALGTTADFKGIILSQTLISLNTGALVNGRLFAQTAVTLQQNAVTQPAP